MWRAFLQESHMKSYNRVKSQQDQPEQRAFIMDLLKIKYWKRN